MAEYTFMHVRKKLVFPTIQICEKKTICLSPSLAVHQEIPQLPLLSPTLSGLSDSLERMKSNISFENFKNVKIQLLAPAVANFRSRITFCDWPFSESSKVFYGAFRVTLSILYWMWNRRPTKISEWQRNISSGVKKVSLQGGFVLRIRL